MNVRLSLTKVIPAVNVPADTPWLKHIKIQSEMLTKFWGHPIFLGAVVLLPSGYEEHPEVSYPTIYQHTHFHLSPPFDFSTDGRQVSEAFREQSKRREQRVGLRVLPIVEWREVSTDDCGDTAASNTVFR